MESELKDVSKEIVSSKDLVEQCRHSSIMLLNLINDLLDLAKQEKLTFKLDKDFFDLSEAVDSAFRTLEFLSKKKNIQTVKTFDKLSLFSNLFGDRNRFEQIFINFLSNALKFTHDGGKVEVKVNSKKMVKTSNPGSSPKPA